jgi:Zn-dependent membrane protease YugP
MVAGLVGFAAGAYLSATGERSFGIVLMAAGLAFQVLTLRQLKLAKKGSNDARG